MARDKRHVLLYAGNQTSIIACRRPVKQHGAGNAAGLAGSSFAKAMFVDGRLNDHLATLQGQRFRSTTSLNA